MKLTPISETLMKEFIDKFDMLSIPSSPIKQKRMDNIFKLIFKDIKNGELYVKSLRKLNKIRSNIKRYKQGEDIRETTLLNSNYVVPSIKTYIEKNIKGYLIFETTIIGRKIEIYFALLSENDLIHIDRFEKYLNYMLIWLKMVSTYSSYRCARTLKIFCFLTPFNKLIPRNQYNILSPEHCNSAVATSCEENGEICIYRKEEFFKVFVHETWHAFGLDFSNLSTHTINETMRNIFPINSEFNLYEAYSETWASIINSAFCSYSFLDADKNVDDFYLYCDFCIKFEQIFSLFQTIKVLTFMGLHYEHLYEKNKTACNIRKYLYKENTNIFAYYIARSVLMFNLSSFLNWCNKNNTNVFNFNKNSFNLKKFGNFIEKNYKNKEFLEKLDIIRRFYRTKKQGILLKTMRMTLCEMILN